MFVGFFVCFPLSVFIPAVKGLFPVYLGLFAKLGVRGGTALRCSRAGRAVKRTAPRAGQGVPLPRPSSGGFRGLIAAVCGPRHNPATKGFSPHRGGSNPPWAEGRDAFLFPKPTRMSKGCDFPSRPCELRSASAYCSGLRLNEGETDKKAFSRPLARPLPFHASAPRTHDLMLLKAWHKIHTAGWKRGRERGREGAGGSRTLLCPGAVLQGPRLPPTAPREGGAEDPPSGEVFPL